MTGVDCGRSHLRQAETLVPVACRKGRAVDLKKGDIDFFVFNTPTAWYADFCVRALDIDAERTFNTYPLYANIGPALWPVTLHHAASAGRLKKGDQVLLYSIGSGSSASAIVMGWGDVGLGAMPASA